MWEKWEKLSWPLRKITTFSSHLASSIRIRDQRNISTFHSNSSSSDGEIHFQATKMQQVMPIFWIINFQRLSLLKSTFQKVKKKKCFFCTFLSVSQFFISNLFIWELSKKNKLGFGEKKMFWIVCFINMKRGILSVDLL